MENYMINKWQDKMDAIILAIKDSTEYQNYQKAFEKMQNNKEIMQIIEEIKSLQKDLVIKKEKGIATKDIDTTIDNKLKSLEEYPLYLEFSYLQEELNNAITIIKKSIEKYLDDIIN